MVVLRNCEPLYRTGFYRNPNLTKIELDWSVLGPLHTGGYAKFIICLKFTIVKNYMHRAHKRCARGGRRDESTGSKNSKLKFEQTGTFGKSSLVSIDGSWEL